MDREIHSIDPHRTTQITVFLLSPASLRHRAPGTKERVGIHMYKLQVILDECEFNF